METELAFHMQNYLEDLVRSGMPRDEAERRMRMEFGGVETHKEAMRASLGLRMWDELWADLRYGARMLRKSPGFTAIAVGSLALGIGANTVIFTLAKQILLDKLAVPHPDELRLLAWTGGAKNVVHSMWGYWDDRPGGKTLGTSFSYPVYQQLRKSNPGLELFAFKDVSRMTATIDGHAESVAGEMVSGNYYDQLEVRPALGRSIGPADDGAEGSGPVALISDAFWARRFARDPSVIGKTIQLNLKPVTVIGVNPPGFTGASAVQIAPEVYFPFSMQPVLLPRGEHSLLSDKDFWWMLIMGRIKPGTNEAQAQASLDVALRAAVRATMTVGKNDEIPHLELTPGNRGENQISSNYEKPTYVLLTLVGFVLMLACANIANLLLARSAARQREMGVRLAMGAGRARVLRQVLTESLMLAVLGGVAGLFLAYGGRDLIPNLLQPSWAPASLTGRFDWRVFVFTAGVSLLTGLIFGIGPAWQSTRTNMSVSLKNSSQTATHRRRGLAGKAIVVFQVALSTLLLVGAGLFVRTLMNLSRVDVGFQARHLLLFSISPPESRYPTPKDGVLLQQIEERISEVPGVDSVTLSSEALVAGNVSNSNFYPVGERPGKQGSAFFNTVGNGFWKTMAIPMVAGRSFNATDTQTSRKVAVINEEAARKYFGGENPVGKTFRTQEKGGEILIAGVCANAKYYTLKGDAPATYYIPYRQSSGQLDDVTFEVRSSHSPADLTAGLRRAVQSVDTDLPMNDVRTQREQIDATITQQRLFAALTAGFGVVALILACIGIYGIMAYSVARRVNEIGIRMALGAQSRQVLGMILGETARLAVAGVLVGLGVSLGLTRFVASMLYGLKAIDPATLGGACALLLGIALVAGWIPARRAAGIEPMQALRHE
jgi:predicted permease